MTENTKIIIDRVIWNILTKYIIEWSHIIIQKDPEIRDVWILQGESQQLDLWLGELKDNNYCMNDLQFNCKRVLKNFANILNGYPEYIDQYEFEKLKNFILTVYPFNLISAEELDVARGKEEIFNFCKIVQLPEYPDIHKLFGIPKEKPKECPISINVETIIDNLLWKFLSSSIIDLSNIIVDEEYSEKYTPFYLGFAKTDIVFIDMLKNEGYTVRDIISEGRDLLSKLYDAINIKLDIELGLKSERIQEYDTMKKFIENTYPLNQIALKSLSGEEPQNLLKDFLEGIPLISPLELIRKKERIDISSGDQLEELLNKVLRENPDSKININFSKGDIELIVKSRLSFPRPGIINPEENIVIETGIEADITENFNLNFYPKGTVLSEEIKAVKRININGHTDVFKGILFNLLKDNPNAIIGDIKIDNVKELKDITDILLLLYPNIIIYIDILERDKEIIKDKIKLLDIKKLKDEDIIFKSNIRGIEISEEFQPIDIEEPGEINRFLIFHIGKIDVIQNLVI